MPRDTVEFSGRVPRELYRAFARAIPIHGANTWFVNRALTLFLEEITNAPSLEVPLQNSINRLIEETLGKHDNPIARNNPSSDTADLLGSDRPSD